MTRIATILLAATLAVPTFGAARAQSFDCANARSVIEMHVFDDAGLSALDHELERLFRLALKRAGADGLGLLEEQRHWLARRNADCAEARPSSAAERDRARSQTRLCLKNAYRSRLDDLAKRAPPDENSRKAPCLKLTEAYAAAVAADPKAGLDTTPVSAGRMRGPLDVAAAVASMAPPLAESEDFHGLGKFRT